MAVQENSRINEAFFAAVNAHGLDGCLNYLGMMTQLGLISPPGND